ncbi:MAG: 2TM domain-containing protein [Methyloceanibacter sp.]
MVAAMLKDWEMRVFLIHLAAFLAGILICAAVNFWLFPDTLWFPWVLIGWGAAVATHAFALLLRKTRRRERIFIDKKARAFAVHLFAYVATVLILLLVNVTVTPKVWWFYWVALGWGAGVAFQGWCTFFKRRPKPPAPAAPKASRPAAKAQAGKTAAKPAAKRTPRQRQSKKKGS